MATKTSASLEKEVDSALQMLSVAWNCTKPEALEKLLLNSPEGKKRLEIIRAEPKGTLLGSTMAKAPAAFKETLYTEAGQVYVSEWVMTRAEGLEGAKNMKGYHMASAKEISALSGELDIKNLLEFQYVITSERGKYGGGLLLSYLIAEGGAEKPGIEDASSPRMQGWVVLIPDAPKKASSNPKALQRS